MSVIERKTRHQRTFERDSGGSKPYSFVATNSCGTRDALVLFQDSYWCGTGGCTMLVFKNINNNLKLISVISLVRDPVIVSETKTKNWRDIIVHVSGGGGETKNIALKFNGSSYPTNPSMIKPLATNTKIQGTKVFSDPR
jgi:hypothetical protein